MNIKYGILAIINQDEYKNLEEETGKISLSFSWIMNAGDSIKWRGGCGMPYHISLIKFFEGSEK